MPCWSYGAQLIVAVFEPMVIVSVVLLCGVRVTVPTVPVIDPWKAPLGAASWARAGCGASAAAAIAIDAQEIISLLHLIGTSGGEACATDTVVISSSMARAGW